MVEVGIPLKQILNKPSNMKKKIELIELVLLIPALVVLTLSILNSNL
jgi:hypothetical protein